MGVPVGKWAASPATKAAASGPFCRVPSGNVAPGAATNEQFTRALGRVVGRRAIAAVPTFALRAALGEMASVVLASQRVLPAAAEQLGYSFAHPELEEALSHVCAKAPPRAVSLAVAS